MADEIDLADPLTPVSNDPQAIDLSTPEAFRSTATKSLPSEPVSAFESFGRGAVEGATFGFEDKLGFDKARREQSRKANPWTHFAGEIVGGIAPMVASGGAAAGLRAGSAAISAAAPRVARAGTGVARGIEAAMLPSEVAGIGGAMAQGAKLGLTYGGLSGAGHADVNEDDDLGSAALKRVTRAVKGAGIGVTLGAPMGAAGHAVGRAAQNVMGARAAANAETADATSGSLVAIARSLERDRITPDDIIGQITREFPDTTAVAGGRRFWVNRQPWTAEQVEQVVRRAIDGESATDISAAMRATGNGTGPGARAVQTLLDELAERHLGPLNLVDRAGMIRTGSGDNTQMTMRAAAATPGQAKSIARENLIERQIGANGRLRNAFERAIGSADYDGVAARHASDLERAGSNAYRVAYANEQPFSLLPIFDRWTRRYDTQRGPVPDGVRQALDDMMTPASGSLSSTPTRWPPQTLEGYINARQNLQQRLTDAKPGSPLFRALTQLKADLDGEVRQTNPLWAVANDLWRDGKAAEDALEAGARQALRLNAASRENLSEFTDAADLVRRGERMIQQARQAGQPTTDGEALVRAGTARQELFRVGLVRSLNDMISNQGETHNLTRVLRLPAARQVIERVLGREDAARLYAVIDAEHAMHRTYSSQFGSQTTPLREAIDDLNWAPRFRSAWELLNPKTAIAAAGEWAASRMNASRNQRMMPLLTETNPTQQLDTLRAVNQVTEARQVGENTVRRPAIGSAGTTANVSTAELLPKPASGNEARHLSQARNALARGAKRSDVERRLRELGIDPGKL